MLWGLLGMPGFSNTSTLRYQIDDGCARALLIGDVVLTFADGRSGRLGEQKNQVVYEDAFHRGRKLWRS
jgi:hypothetical protein